MVMRLKDKVALVTGGSRSIGRAIAVGFAREGADVAVNYATNAAAAEALVQEICSRGRRAIAVRADVSNPAHVRAMVDRVVETFGRIDILVNNAGVISRAPFLELSEREWDRIHQVDLKGAFLVSQAVARRMVERGGGAIINMSSISAHAAQKNISHYTAAKAGVSALTRAMALELAGHGIRVNALEPGTLETDINRTRLSDPDERARVMERVPLGRLGSPEDLVGAAIFLASDESAFATGCALRIDGGRTLSS